MIHLALRTEYSFRSCFGHIKETVEFHNGQGVVGIADDNNTYGHVQFEKACKEKGIKPIFGVRLKVVRGVDERARRRLPGPRYIFLAKNADGLQELYGLVRKAWDRYYFEPMLGLIDVWSLSENIIVIAENYEVPERIDYIALTASTSKLIAAQDIPKVYINNNFYPHTEDRPVYELLAGSQKRGEEYIAKFEHQTYAQHIMGKDEFMRLWGCEEAAENTIRIAEMCNVTLPKSGMVKYHGTQDLHELCVRGAARKGIDLTDSVYLARYENEMALIKSKEFTDYFLIVSDMIRKAKRDMLVGPSRGSSAGSLVCYLCDITEIDPIKHGLLFERFIAVNRTDLPDIDIDFPDEKREKVIEELVKTHNSESVGHIANINSFKPKSAIGEFAIGLGIPKYETDIVKDAIIERSGGDARAAMRVADTFDTTESGRDFIDKYPAMKLVARIEGHANHAGTHAAGILVSNDPIIKYAGVDSRAGTAMIDKKDAEYLGLLKIDCLGLRTLTVLEDCAKLVKFRVKDFYTMPLDDPKAYQIFKDMRLSGIFQFEGQAMRLLCKQMGCTEFNDIVALTALARPGPLHSGGANTFIARRIGDDPTEYICDHPSYLDATKETYGVLIYQEQLIQLCRDLGKMDWADINAVRNAMSKSLGAEYFNKYRSKFLAGTRENDIADDTAIQIWENMVTFGSWGMNKCVSKNTRVRIAYPNQMLGPCPTIEELYAAYVESPSPWIKQRNSMPVLLSFDGECAKPVEAINIHRNGPKPCVLLEFDNGQSIECTRDHKFIINGEWSACGDAKIGDEFKTVKKKSWVKPGPNPGRGKGWRAGRAGAGQYDIDHGIASAYYEFKRSRVNEPCEDCMEFCNRMEVHHGDFNKGMDDKNDLVWLCSGCHKKRHMDAGNWLAPYGRGYVEYEPSILISISDIGEIETYDIEMPNPNHNYVLANGIVTHNSHTVSYGVISYWCAYMKAHHPLEFAVANLNNMKSEESAIKLLRDLVENEGIEYVPVDPDISMEGWTVHEGKLYGGLLNIDGIGPMKAKGIIKTRSTTRRFAPGIMRTLMNPKTPFDILYPTRHFWGEIYDTPEKYGLNSPPNLIRDIQGTGNFLIIGKLMSRDLRDMNDYNELVKRGGQVFHENNMYLKLVVEDDTDQILCKINRFKFQQLNGQHIAESSIVGKTWFLIQGKITGGWRVIDVENILNLNQYFWSEK